MVYRLTWKDKTPRRTVISRRGLLAWSSEEMDSLTEDMHQASTPKKRRLSRMSSQEEMVAQIRTENREGQKWKPVNPPWSHLNSHQGFLDREIVFSFSVSVGALESHHVSERPRHSHPHRRGDGGSELLQGLPVEAWVGSVVRLGHTCVLITTRS